MTDMNSSGAGVPESAAAAQLSRQAVYRGIENPVAAEAALASWGL